MIAMNREIYMSPKEYAALHRIGIATLRRWLTAGNVEGAVQPGGARGQWWIPRKAI